MYQLLSSPFQHCRSPSTSSSQMDELLLLLESTYIKDNNSSTNNSNGIDDMTSTRIIPQPMEQIIPQQQQHIKQEPLHLILSSPLVTNHIDCQEDEDEQLSDNETEDEEEEEEDEEYSDEEISEDESEEDNISDLESSDGSEDENEEDDDEEESYDSNVSESDSEDEQDKSQKKLKPLGLIRPSMIYKYGNSDSDSDDDEEDQDEEDGQESESEESNEDLMNQFEDLIPNYSFECPAITTPSPPHILVNGIHHGDELYDRFDEEELMEQSEDYKKKFKLLQLEKEKDILTSIRSSSPNPIKFIPTWFGNEDESQIRIIVQEYQDYLFQEHKIDANCVRAPKPFIGRIHRRTIQLNNTPMEFTTIDTVKVYRWEIQPIGRPLNIFKTFVVLTNWDIESGVPLSFKKIISLSDKEIWHEQYKQSLLPSPTNRNMNKDGPSKSSYIYCSPIFDCESEYQYSVCTEKYPIDFLPKSSPKASMRRNTSHPSLLLNSKIYSHTLIPQDEFNFKYFKNLDNEECGSDY